jgi:hypothetical protein
MVVFLCEEAAHEQLRTRLRVATNKQIEAKTVRILILSPFESRCHNFFALFLDDSTTYRSNNKTTDKETNKSQPTPPYPDEETNYDHKQAYETEHTRKSPLKNPSNKIHKRVLLAYLVGLYKLLKRLSSDT